MHGTLNSVLSRVGSLTTLVTEANQVQQECARTESALASMHDRLNVNATNYTPTNAKVVPNINHTSACNDDSEVTKTYAAAAASPTQESPRATREPEDLTSKTLTITLGAKKPSHVLSPQNSQETETNPTDNIWVHRC